MFSKRFQTAMKLTRRQTIKRISQRKLNPQRFESTLILESHTQENPNKHKKVVKKYLRKGKSRLCGEN